MADSRDDDKPQYTLYRARPKLFRRAARDDGGLREMQQAPPRGYERAAAPSRAPTPARAARAARISVWRVVALAASPRSSPGWPISLVLFLVSAQIQSAKVSDAADTELGGARLPADARRTRSSCSAPTRAPKGSKEPGANKIGQPSPRRTRSC